MKDMEDRVLENLRNVLEDMDPIVFVLQHQECFKNEDLIWNKKLNDEVLNETQINFLDDFSRNAMQISDKIWEVCNLEEVIEQKYSQFLLQKSEKERVDWFENELSIDEINYHLGINNLFALSKQKIIVDYFYDYYYTQWSLNSLKWILYKNLEKISVSSIRNNKIDSLLLNDILN